MPPRGETFSYPSAQRENVIVAAHLWEPTASLSVLAISKKARRQKAGQTCRQFLTDNSFNNQAEKSERKRPLYVCRVLHTTVWVAGTQRGDEQRCTVTIHGSVQSYDKYELLENVDNAARVNWEHWDKYMPTPIGAVATENMFVARQAVHNDKEVAGETTRYTHYIGTLNSNDNLGTISYVRGVSNCYAIPFHRRNTRGSLADGRLVRGLILLVRSCIQRVKRGGN